MGRSKAAAGRSRAAALALGISIALSACDARSAVDRRISRPVLRMSGNATIISPFLSLPQFSVQASDIGDSEKRLVALQHGSIDLAVAVADVSYLAFNGKLPDRSPPLDNIRGIALLHSAAVHLLIGPTTNPSGGFRGMRVVLGNPTGENAALGERLISSMGIAKSQIRGEFLPRDPAVEKLLSGDVDALIVTGRLPQEPVVRALRGGARLLDIDGPEVDRLRVHYPILRRMLIPRGTYPAQHLPVHTVGVDLLLVCRADLDKNLVYELTRAYFEDTPENIQRQTDPQRAPAVVIPLHPGAARYYREREVRR
jgi:TRAP transporter TAXI family solute receptor